MDYTRFTNLEVTGELKATAEKAKEAKEANEAKAVKAGAVHLSKSANYELAAAEKVFYIGATLTAASKTVTLGLDENQVAIVNNEGGTNAFTLKNVSGDSGTSLAAGKAALVVGSKTANSSIVVVLN